MNRVDVATEMEKQVALLASGPILPFPVRYPTYPHCSRFYHKFPLANKYIININIVCVADDDYGTKKINLIEWNAYV